MNKAIVFSSLAVLIVLLPIYLTGYHGARSFEKESSKILPSQSLVVNNAKRLIGTPYDPLMGMYGNIGSSLGFIICSDVPNIAYGLSGFSLKKVMSRNFNKDPNAYDTSNDNNPSNPYFHRRARNIYAYFKSVGKLESSNFKPSLGDLVFYTKHNSNKISHIALVTEISTKGYKIVESAPKILTAKEVNNNSPINRGWRLVGFGKVYR